MAAEWITPDAVNFMVTHGRGLICLSLTGERVDALDLAPMVPSNDGTAFTVSIDLRTREHRHLRVRPGPVHPPGAGRGGAAR